MVIKKINALLLLMFYAPVFLIVFFSKWNAYPVIKEDRGDFTGGILLYGITLTLLFSFLMPKLKLRYQFIIGFLLGGAGVVFIYNYVSGFLVAGIIAGMCLHGLLHIAVLLYSQSRKV